MKWNSAVAEVKRMTSEAVAALAENFSWAKVLYSGVLIGVIVLLGGELRRLWFDTTLHVGTFQFFEDGEEKVAQGRAFALQVLNYHRTLVFQLGREATRRNTPAKAAGAAGVDPAGAPLQENTWWPREVVPIHDPKSALNDVELSVQGVNLKQLLTSLRQWVSTPNEVYGTVEKSNNVVRGTASWPRGPSRSRGDLVDGQLLEIKGQADSAPAAFQVACGLIWAQAARRQAELAGIESQDFCDWAGAWSAFVGLRDKAARLEGLDEGDIGRVKQLRAALTRFVDRGVQYPEIRRLRADLVDLLPVDQKSDNDLAQAQSDRTYYAIHTDPEKRKLPKDVVEYVTVAEARPAIVVGSDKLVEPISDTWRSVLEPQADTIMAAANATGFVRISGKGRPPEGFVGFLVAPRIVATVGFPFRQWLGAKQRSAFSLGPDVSCEFSFTHKLATEGPIIDPIAVEQVIFGVANDGENYTFALLRLAGEYDTSRHRPLDLELSPATLEAAVGRYVFTVGYPSWDVRRLPVPFVEHLLGKNPEVKRVMPGRIASIGRDLRGPTTLESGQPRAGQVRVITSDLSTTGGTSGGPLVDLRTGRVLGVHFAGQWEDKKGKFAHASSIADILAVPTVPKGVRDELGLDQELE